MLEESVATNEMVGMLPYKLESVVVGYQSVYSKNWFCSNTQHLNTSIIRTFSYLESPWHPIGHLVYLDLCILDLSKTLMCDFHCTYIKESMERKLSYYPQTLAYEIQMEDLHI